MALLCEEPPPPRPGRGLTLPCGWNDRLIALAKFAAAIGKKYQMELAPLLQYLSQQMLSGTQEDMVSNLPCNVRREGG